MENYKCEKCTKTFNTVFELKKHKKNCIQFKGLAIVDREGYRDNLLGNQSIDEIWDELEGKNVCITIIE